MKENHFTSNFQIETKLKKNQGMNLKIEMLFGILLFISAYSVDSIEQSYSNVLENPISNTDTSGKTQPQHLNEHGQTDYEFSYFVHDDKTKDIKMQKETRKGDSVHGQYELLDSDGYKRIVSYLADDLNGFKAKIHRRKMDTNSPNSKQTDSGNYFEENLNEQQYQSIIPIGNANHPKPSKFLLSPNYGESEDSQQNSYNTSDPGIFENGSHGSFKTVQNLGMEENINHNLPQKNNIPNIYLLPPKESQKHSSNIPKPKHIRYSMPQIVLTAPSPSKNEPKYISDFHAPPKNIQPRYTRPIPSKHIKHNHHKVEPIRISIDYHSAQQYFSGAPGQSTEPDENSKNAEVQYLSGVNNQNNEKVILIPVISPNFTSSLNGPQSINRSH